MKKQQYQNWLDEKIGDPSEKSIGIGKSVMFIAVLILFVNPFVEITFGKASLAGLGINVSPAVTVPVGNLLLLILTYKLISFGVNLVIDNGMNHSKSHTRVVESYMHEEQLQPYDMDGVINQEAGSITFKWRVRKIIWVVFVPIVLAIFAYLKFFAFYFGIVQ